MIAVALAFEFFYLLTIFANNKFEFDNPLYYTVFTALLLMFDVLSLGSPLLNQNIALILMSWVGVYAVDSLSYHETNLSMFADRSMLVLIMAVGINMTCMAFAATTFLTTLLTFVVPLMGRQWMEQSQLSIYLKPTALNNTTVDIQQSSNKSVQSDELKLEKNSVNINTRLTWVQSAFATQLGF